MCKMLHTIFCVVIIAGFLPSLAQRVQFPQNTFHNHHNFFFGGASAGFSRAGLQFAGIPNVSSQASAFLFTPNTNQQPAATPGQIENYRKDLEDEAKEIAENELKNDRLQNLGLSGGYVEVKLGGNGQYSYRF